MKSSLSVNSEKIYWLKLIVRIKVLVEVSSAQRINTFWRDDWPELISFNPYFESKKYLLYFWSSLSSVESIGGIEE
jgi:hypothetical protein